MTALSLVYPIQNLVTSIAVGFGIGINATAAFFPWSQKGRYRRRCHFHRHVSQPDSWNSHDGAVHCRYACISASVHFRCRCAEFRSDLFQYGLSVCCDQHTGHILYEKIFQSVGRMNVFMISMLIGCISNII